VSEMPEKYTSRTCNWLMLLAISAVFWKEL